MHPPKAQTPINAQAQVLHPSLSPTGERLHRQPTEGASSFRLHKLSGNRTEGGALTECRCFLMLTYIFVIAITAEAMSGALAAGRRNMDLFGVALIAFMTALGGGTVRDMLLGNYPVTWTQHPLYIYMTIGAGLFTIVIAKYMRRLNRLFLLVDGMGLVAFTIIGCNVALTLDYETPVVIMAGITTGIFGGILRDIMCNRTPQVLRHELYASVSFLVAILYLVLIYFEINENINLMISFVFGLGMRMAALKWQWSLPVFSYSPDRWND